MFETVDRIFPEVDEVVRGMSDDEIARRAVEPRAAAATHRRRDAAGAVHRLIGRDGRPLASSDRGDLRRRRFRRSRLLQGAGGRPCRDLCRRGAQGAPDEAGDLFELSHRLGSADGAFRGVIAVAVRPRYFNDFYAMIEQSPGNFYELVRSDGVLLARYPSTAADLQQLKPASALRLAIADGTQHGLYSVTSRG